MARATDSEATTPVATVHGDVAERRVDQAGRVGGGIRVNWFGGACDRPVAESEASDR
jgi:hypothetical protein